MLSKLQNLIFSFLFPYSSGCGAGGGATGLLLPNAGTGAGANAGAVLALLPPNGALPNAGAVLGAGVNAGVGMVAPALSPSFSCVRP